MEFAPDLCSRVTFVNFTVTRSSLQSQCLNQVLKAERPDVDQKRSDLLKLQGNSIYLFIFFNFFLLVRFNLEQYILWLKKEKRKEKSSNSNFISVSFSGEFHLRLRHLEKSLLQALNDAKGRILDDDR